MNQKDTLTRSAGGRQGGLRRTRTATSATCRYLASQILTLASASRYLLGLPLACSLPAYGLREGRMYRVWYWAMIDRENDGRFVASIPDLWDIAAYGDTDKDAVAHVTDLAAERVRAAVDDGQPVPRRRQFAEMPNHIRSKEVGRAIIPVEVGRREAWPTPPYHMSP